MSTRIPYHEIDELVRELVRSLSEFRGITTIGSCGGHENPDEYQEPLGSWFVTFHVSRHTGWESLNQIAGVSNEYVYDDDTTKLIRSYVTVDVNSIGAGTVASHGLFFAIRGHDVSADDVAKTLRQIRTGELKIIEYVDVEES